MLKHPSYLTIEEILTMPTLTATHISEDGAHLLYMKRVADWESNTYKHEIWVHEKNQGKQHQLNVGEGAQSPTWSPDAKWIAYLSPVNSGEKRENQLFVKRLENGDTMQLTRDEEGVSQYKWAQNGEGLYYVTNACSNAVLTNQTVETGEEKAVNRLSYCKLNRENHINSTSTAIVDEDFFIVEFDVSADGEKVALIAAPGPSMREYMKRDLYIKNTKSGELTRRHRDNLLEGKICFSPDGNQICYSASIQPKEHVEFHILEYTLEMMDFESGQVHMPLGPHDSSLLPIRWTAQGIVVRWQDKTNYRIGIVQPDGSVKPLLDITEGFISEPSITQDGKHIAYLLALPNETFELYCNDEKLTNENNVFVGKLKSVREVISWKSIDGTEIEGVLTTPVHFNPNKKYPLLIVAHGGPAWASFPFFSNCFNGKYPIEQFIEKGFLVLEPNYKGSSGYGNEFLQANYQSLGIAYYDDVITGVDALVEKGIVDKARVGIVGWSNGGYVTAFCAMYSDRFQVASVGGGITNWHTHYVHTDIPYAMKMHLGSTPWENPSLYAKLSPVAYVNRAKTPTLIQHGELDLRVPVTNAYELYRGLQDNDVETKLFVFKGMAYDAPNPATSALIMKQNLEWVMKHIGDAVEN